MNRFVSNFASRLDAKGRVSIPAPFRAVLARDGFEGLYVHPALDAPALDAGGNTLMAEIEAFLLGFSPYSEERDRLATALYRHERDPQGRSGGQGGPHREPEEPCRHRRRGRLRRARAQVPDLGAERFRGAPVGGAGEGSRAAEILGRRGARAGAPAGAPR